MNTEAEDRLGIRATSHKIKIGVSRCLIGEKVRYDGGHRLDRYITGTLGIYFEYVRVCPEVEYGLSVPREMMRLEVDPISPRLVTIHTRIDHRKGMTGWTEKKIGHLAKENLCGFIFKSRSPSCGIRGVPVYREDMGKSMSKGTGLFAGSFVARFPLIPVEDERSLGDPVLRDNFIERVLVYRRWQEFIENGGSAKGLIDFHTHHKLLIMAHSPKHCSDLGRLVTGSRGDQHSLFTAYITMLTESLRFIATTRKHTDVLRHIMGYLKKQLTVDEKQELLQVIEGYRSGLVPLIVPITLLKHYVQKYDEPYLEADLYLNPSPAVLMLRNHA